MAQFPTVGVTQIAPPTLEPRAVGLFASAEVRDIAPSARERMGFDYESDSCFDAHVIDEDAATCIAAALDEDTFDGFGYVESDDRFSIYAAVTCNPVARNLDFSARAIARLDANAELLVEQHLWQNDLPEKAVDLTLVSGAVSPARGLRILEAYAAANYRFRATAHMGVETAGILAERFLVGASGTYAGSKAVMGGGYTNLGGPDGTLAGDDEAWMYISGQTLLLRTTAEAQEALDPQSNTRLAVAVQTFVPAIDCFAAAIRITLE